MMPLYESMGKVLCSELFMPHIVVNGLGVYHFWQQCWYFHFVKCVLVSQKQKNISQSRHCLHKPYAHAYLKLN